MIRLERTRDYELVAALMTAPRIYSALADDFYPSPENFVPHQGDNIFHLLAFDGEELLGLFVAHPINLLLWETHVFLAPQGLGPRGYECGQAFFRWLWEFTPARVAMGCIPSWNTLALRYARRAGMCEVARLPQCHMRHGQLHDIVILQLLKGS